MNLLGGAAVRPEIHATVPRFARMRAKAAGETRYFSGRQCNNGHMAERYTSSGTCVICWPGGSEWIKNNPERSAAYRETHSADYASYKGNRRAREKPPEWSKPFCIKAFYRIAERLRNSTGIEFTVDHVIPLQGRKVSGLHVRENLQILTAAENSRKHNKFVVV